MFGKYVLSLTALVLLVAVVSIHAAPEPQAVEQNVQAVEDFKDDSYKNVQSVEELENNFYKMWKPKLPKLPKPSKGMNSFMKKTIKKLQEYIKDVAEECLVSAAQQCSSEPDVLSCAEAYVAENCQLH